MLCPTLTANGSQDVKILIKDEKHNAKGKDDNR